MRTTVSCVLLDSTFFSYHVPVRFVTLNVAQACKKLSSHSFSSEDVRDLNQECSGKNRAGPNEVELAKKLIKKLKFKYKPEKFTNPKLAAHWSAIEALALNLKEPEPFVDSTCKLNTILRQTDRTGPHPDRLLFSSTGL